MEDLSTHVGPEFVYQVHSCVAQEIKGHAITNRSHTLGVARHIEIAERLGCGAAQYFGSIEGGMTAV